MKEILATCFIPVAIMIIQQVWIVHTYQERNVLVGEMVELECPFDTWLAIWVYWKKDNETIYSLKVEPQGVTSWSNDTARYLGTSQAKYLTITDLRETDSGVYDCKVVKDRPIYIILDSAYEGSLVRLSVIEYINGRCMAARKRRGYNMNSSGSHDDPEGAKSVPLVKPDESLRKNDDSGSNAPQKRIHGHDGEQQKKNDSMESQIHRSELTPEFDASQFSIEEEIGHGPPDDDDNVDAGPGDGEDTHRALIHGYDGEQQQKRDSVDSQISEFIPSDASSPFTNKENSKPTKYQLPLVGKLLLIDLHRAVNKDAVVSRLLDVVHFHVEDEDGDGKRLPPISVEHRSSLEKFFKDRYPDQRIPGYTVREVSYVLHELDKIPDDRWRDRCEVLLTMPEYQQQDKSVFYSESINDSTRVVSENNSNDDNPERLGLLKDQMEFWMANPDKRKQARYFISREILYADVKAKQTMTKSFIDSQKSVPDVGYESSLSSDKYDDEITGDLVDFWMSKVQKLHTKCQQRILTHLYKPISEEDDYDGQQKMAAAGGAPQTKDKINELASLSNDELVRSFNNTQDELVRAFNNAQDELVRAFNNAQDELVRAFNNAQDNLVQNYPALKDYLKKKTKSINEPKEEPYCGITNVGASRSVVGASMSSKDNGKRWRKPTMRSKP